MAESKRYILDRANGINVMANLYIIRYLYHHIDKAECFLADDRRRRKSIDFYGEILHMSRQRVQRVFRGDSFELSARHRNQLSNMFGIDEEYFLKNGKTMSIHLLDSLKWKLFFENRHNGTSTNVDKEIEKALKKLCEKDNIAQEYDTSTPIYRVYYYFKHGVRFQEESKIERFKKELLNLKLPDWEELENDIEQLEKCRDMLKKHYDYVKTVVDYKRMKGQ